MVFPSRIKSVSANEDMTVVDYDVMTIMGNSWIKIWWVNDKQQLVKEFEGRENANSVLYWFFKRCDSSFENI